jgi:UvrD-like helicase C-terminal domain
MCGTFITKAIQFDGNNDVEYFEPSELELNGLPRYVTYGYASTIHKSQGGEYQHVIAVVPRNLAFTFGKPSLYTAVTRAKQTLTIMGALDELPDITGREDARRCTALKSLLGLPLINPPALKPELKSELKGLLPGLDPGNGLKAGKIVDLDAAFKAMAERMAMVGDGADPSEDEGIDIG